MIAVRLHHRQRSGAFTLIELMAVIAIIIVLAGLVLSISGYAHEKGARSRAETEIAAMSAAVESYKADNGIYPRTLATDSLNAKISTDPSNYQSASLYLYTQLSGLDTNQQAVANMKTYFAFKSQMLGHPSNNTTTVSYIRDPWGNSYGYSTANQSNSSNGYNPTFDLWSTAGTGTSATPTPTPAATPQNLWIKNW